MRAENRFTRGQRRSEWKSGGKPAARYGKAIARAGRPRRVSRNEEEALTCDDAITFDATTDRRAAHQRATLRTGSRARRNRSRWA
jgi:hypothetical protein